MTAQLVQANVARLRAALSSEQLSAFVGAVDPVNRMAEASPGFVWRLPPGAGHVVTTVSDGDAELVVNVSVWTSYEALHAFVYRSQHGGLVRARARWFVPLGAPSTVLWWAAPAGARPTVEEALARHRRLVERGPTASAFTQTKRFDPAGRPTPGRPGRRVRPSD